MSEEEMNSLKQRLNISSLDKDIFVSELGTVSMGDKETTFDNFVKEVDLNISNGNNLVKYDKETNRFFLVEKNNRVAHMIDINDNDMKDYAFGMYDNTTFKMHDLLLKSEDKNENDLIENKNEDLRNQVIVKTRNSHDELTPLEARIYLDYLEGIDRSNAKVVAKQSSKVAAITGIPLASGVAATAMGISAATTAFGLIPAIAIGAITTATIAMVEELVAMFKNDEASYFGGNAFGFVKEAIEEIKEKISEIKVNKVKENHLRQIDYVDKIVMPDGFTVEEEPTKSLNLEDKIMNEINSIVDKVSLINPQDREIMLEKAKQLLNTYMERSKAIINQDQNTFGQDTDNMVNLRLDVCRELAKMEMKVNEIREKDRQHKVLNDEGKLLDNKISNISNKEQNTNNELEEILKDSTNYDTLEDKEKKLA